MKKVSLSVAIFLSFLSHSQAGQKRYFLKQQEQFDFFKNTFFKNNTGLGLGNNIRQTKKKKRLRVSLGESRYIALKLWTLMS